MPIWIDRRNWSSPCTSSIWIQFPIKGYFSWGMIRTEEESIIIVLLSWLCIQREWQGWRKLQEQLFTIMTFTLVLRLKTAHGHWMSQCGIIPSSFLVDHWREDTSCTRGEISKPQWWESCDLERICGKMLACICPDVASCHGHILAWMVHDKQPNEYKNLFHALPEDKSLSIDGGDVVFFKGEKCPLSNYYYCDDCWMELWAVADDDEHVNTDDSNYNEPKLRYGAQQAFAALKARKMGWMLVYRKIVLLRNALQLHAAIEQMECYIQGGSGWTLEDDGHNKDHVPYNKGKVGLKIGGQEKPFPFFECNLDNNNTNLTFLCGDYFNPVKCSWTNKNWE